MPFFGPLDKGASISQFKTEQLRHTINGWTTVGLPLRLVPELLTSQNRCVRLDDRAKPPLGESMRITVFMVIALLWVCEAAFSQSDLSPKFRFYRNRSGEVDAIDYWGNSGLRNGELHELKNLRSVTIAYGSKLTDDDLNYLSSLDQIEGLQIGQDIIDSPVSIEGDLAVLGKLKSLDWVHLCKHDIENADLEFIASLQKITHLEFNADANFRGKGSTVSDQCATYIGHAKTLESICIQGCGKLTDRFVATISDALPNLEHLDLNCPALTDASLGLLAKRCKKLKWLDLSSDKFTDLGIQHLSTAKNMEMLWIDSSALTSNCIESIASLQKLRHLELTVPAITDKEVQIIANLERLEIIALRKPQLTDTQFQLLADHPELESGFLNGERMSIENTLKIIATIPTLKHLNVGSKNADLQAAVNRALKTRQTTNY